MIVITHNYKFSLEIKSQRGLQAGVSYHTRNIEIENKILAELFLGLKVRKSEGYRRSSALAGDEEEED